MPNDANTTHPDGKARPTALVTGASRGIGKAIALALAADGYDVAITARTVEEGQTTAPETGAVLPGSLTTTAAEIEALGRRCVIVRLNLLELDTLEPAVDEVVAAFDGSLDVVVNNAIYVGPGGTQRFGESDPIDLVNRVNGNVTAQLLITHRALGYMLAAGGGTFVNITSDAGQRTPERAAGEGGWSLIYAATKAGFHRIADMLAVEYDDRGIKAFNVNPGFVATERVLAAGESLAFVAERGAAPEVVGRAVAKLLRDNTVPNGSYLHAQDYIAGARSA